jgi:hypothetical protein
MVNPPFFLLSFAEQKKETFEGLMLLESLLTPPSVGMGKSYLLAHLGAIQ